MNVFLHTKVFLKYEELLLLFQTKPCDYNLPHLYTCSCVEKGF